MSEFKSQTNKALLWELLNDQNIFKFFWKKTGYAIIKIKEKKDGRFIPFLLNKKQINKVKNFSSKNLSQH